MQIAVNVAPLQFQQDDVPRLVARVLAETGLLPDRLELEIAEAAITANPEGVSKELRKLVALGVRVVFDEVTGSVNVPRFVKDIPFSKITIARDLVMNLESLPSARSSIRMIVLVGSSVNVPVAASGIETVAQLAYLLKQGCQFIQGLLIARPAPMSSFARMTGNNTDELRSSPPQLADIMRTSIPDHAGDHPALEST